jgi:hypothetical protein
MPVSARLIVNQAALKTKRDQLQGLIGALEKAAHLHRRAAFRRDRQISRRRSRD